MVLLCNDSENRYYLPTSPNHEWIEDLETSLANSGYNTDTIVAFHKCLTEAGHNYNQAKEYFPGRVLTREQGLEYLKSIIPLRAEQ